jgi:hypothetical protein
VVPGLPRYISNTSDELNNLNHSEKVDYNVLSLRYPWVKPADLSFHPISSNTFDQECIMLLSYLRYSKRKSTAAGDGASSKI